MPDLGRRELSSWKEIATHLGVGVRTAQVWEKERGLPVRRVPGSRGGVFASVRALDDWRAAAPRPVPPRSRWVALGGGLAVVGTVIVLALVWRAGRPVPASWSLEKDTLIIRGIDGAELWRRVFPTLNAGDYAARASNHWKPVTQLHDLDGDGRAEVLFAHFVHDTNGTQSAIVAHTPSGEERWRVPPGRLVTTTARRFVPPFVIQEFSVATIRGQARVFVTADHHRYWPTVFTMLDPNGRVLGEYFHAGALSKLHVASLNGTPRIYLGGVANTHRQATLVVLDPDHVTGASREPNPDYQLTLPPAREVARLLFPRSCVNQRLASYTRVFALEQEPDGLAVRVQHLNDGHAEIIYHLTNDLRVREVVVSEHFKLTHQQLHTKGEIDHSFTDQEAATLRQVEHLAIP